MVKSALFLHFFEFEDDKLFQTVAAYNLASGNGLVYKDVQTNNLHDVIKIPLNRWPMGYSLCVAALYKVTDNLIAATLVFDLFFIFLFFLVLKKILQELEFPLYLINILTLFNGFAIGIYLRYPTDLHAAALVLVSIYFTLRFYNSGLNPIKYGILMGILGFLPSFFRYMYIPSSVIAGSVLLFLGMMKKDKNLIRGAIYSLVTTTALTMGFLIFNKIYFGSSSYIMPMEKGVYLFHLFKMYPFLYGSFINLNFIGTQLELRTGLSFAFWFNIFIYANLITCGFIFLKFKRLAGFQNIKIKSPRHLFVLINIGIIIMIILLTGYLSVTNGGYRITLRKVGFWTFIGDGRYFTFAMIVIPIIVVLYLFTTPSTKAVKFIQYLFLFLVAFEIAHTSRFLIKNFSWKTSISNATLPLELKGYLVKHIAELKKQRLDVVLTGNSENVGHWSFLNGAKGLVDVDKIINNVPMIDSSTILLLVIRKEDKAVYDPFLIKSKSRIDSTIGQYAVYSYQLRRCE